MNNKILSLILITFSLIMVSCGNDDDEPKNTYPIRFVKQTYSIPVNTTSTINIYDGSGKYEIKIGNPSVISSARISENTLSVTPVSTGESTLTVIEPGINHQATITIKVTDFYIPFKVLTINGDNKNPYIKRESIIKFIAANDNKRLINIDYDNKLDAEGTFDITLGESKATLNMLIKSQTDNEYNNFDYTISGSTNAILNYFNKIFGFGWKNLTSSRESQPIILDLTDSNGCEIRCIFNGYHF